MSYVTIDNIKIFYTVFGDLQSNSEKPTLIFLHGGAGLVDHTLYTSFWSRFSEESNVVFVDLRGCGRSDKGDPSKWNLEQNGKDVYLFCEALGITHPIVAGVSWGGYIAISYGIQYPEHPKALILCNTEAKISPQARYEAFLRIATEQAANAVKAFDENWNASTDQDYFKYCLPFYAKRAYTPEEFGSCIRNPDLWEKYMKTEHAKFDFTDQLHQIACPVLHLAGENDPIHPVFSAEETAQKIGNNCQLEVICETGDPVYRDKPDESAAIINNFITSLSLKNNFSCRR